MRKRGTVEVRSQGHFDRLDADFEQDESRETASPVGTFVTENDASTGQGAFRATLSIDVRDCIGCEVCVAHCDRGVLRMLDGKAMVDLRHLNRCDLDGECVKVCPTNVVSLKVVPLEDPVELTVAEAQSLADPANNPPTRRAG